jgi:hypothetical protein
MRAHWPPSRATSAALLAGALAGLAGALLFAAAHAWLIVPIWDRMTFGLLSGAVAGLAGGWALAELEPAYAAGRWSHAAARGLRFGALLWLLVTPVTAADALLRAVGVAPRLELVAVGVALVLAVAGGGAYGWWRTRRRRGAVAGGAATLALVIAMAGPVPVARSARAMGIFAAVLPAAALGGAVLAVVARRLHRSVPTHEAPAAEAPPG